MAYDFTMKVMRLFHTHTHTHSDTKHREDKSQKKRRRTKNNFNLNLSIYLSIVEESAVTTGNVMMTVMAIEKLFHDI